MSAHTDALGHLGRSMVNDPQTDDLIHWSKDGDSFLGEIMPVLARLPRCR